MYVLNNFILSVVCGDEIYYFFFLVFGRLFFIMCFVNFKMFLFLLRWFMLENY